MAGDGYRKGLIERAGFSLDATCGVYSIKFVLYIKLLTCIFTGRIFSLNLFWETSGSRGNSPTNINSTNIDYLSAAPSPHVCFGLCAAERKMTKLGKGPL